MSINPSRRGLATLAVGAASLVTLFAGSRPAAAGNQLGVAISGVDATSFHDGRPRAGNPNIFATYNRALWYFQSEATRDRFRAEPARFAPQFDGYCAWAASQNYIWPGNPEFWRLVDGKLYLKVNEEAQRLWLADIPGNIVKGNTNWPRIHPF